MLFRQNVIPGNLSFESNNGANEGGTLPPSDPAGGEVVSKAEYEKIKQSLENERNANKRLAQDKQVLKAKADKYEEASAIFAKFTENPSAELAEQVLGVAPGTLTKGMTKAEKKETEPDDMSDEARTAVEMAKKMIAEERASLKKEIDELKKLREEDIRKNNTTRYSDEFKRVMEKEFSLDSLNQFGDKADKIQRSIARNLHTLMLTGQFQWPDAVKEIKDEFEILTSTAQKTQVTEAKKVAEQHSKSQSSGSQPATVAPPEREGKPKTLREAKERLSQSKKKFREGLQSIIASSPQEQT